MRDFEREKESFDKTHPITAKDPDGTVFREETIQICLKEVKSIQESLAEAAPFTSTQDAHSAIASLENTLKKGSLADARATLESMPAWLENNNTFSTIDAAVTDRQHKIDVPPPVSPRTGWHSTADVIAARRTAGTLGHRPRHCSRRNKTWMVKAS